MFMDVVTRNISRLLLNCATAIWQAVAYQIACQLIHPHFTQPTPTGMPSYHHHLHKSKVNDTMGAGGRWTTNAVGRTSDGMGNIFVPSVSDLSAHFRFGGTQLNLDESL